MTLPKGLYPHSFKLQVGTVNAFMTPALLQPISTARGKQESSSGCDDAFPCALCDQKAQQPTQFPCDRVLMFL